VTTPALSIVIPVHDEAATLDELLRRCLAAGEAIGRSFEVVVVDDASGDATAAVLGGWSGEPRVVVRRLARNVGQFGATREGLAASRGETVVLLDGDLQDPPEVVPDLVRRLDASPVHVGVAFATKTRRSDPAWFRAAAATYRLLVRVGARPPPAGAGSFCAMRRSVADEVAEAPARHANVAAVIAASGAEWTCVPYQKNARRDGTSRVGVWGLVAEGLGSLVVVGGLRRIFAILAVLAAGVALLSTQAGVRGSALALMVVAATVGFLAGPCRRRRRPHAPPRRPNPLAEAGEPAGKDGLR